MGTIKRYSPLPGDSTREDENGDLVEFDDHRRVVLRLNEHLGYLEGLLREHAIEHRQIHGGKVTYSRCDKHGPYVRTDENQCPACWRGE